MEKILVKEATFAIDHTGGLSLLLDMCKIWREWSQTVSLVQLQLDDIWVFKAVQERKLELS